MKVSRKRLNYNDTDDTDNTNDIEPNNKYYKLDTDILNINCISKTCTHEKKSNKLDKLDKIYNKSINNLDDLINLSKMYNCIYLKEYNGINLRVLNNLLEPLEELNKMIGLTDIKNKLIDQILYLCRGYNSIPCNICIDCHLKIPCCSNSKEMLHTVITGSPGVGKTELARILAKIYAKCGFVKNDKLIEVTRKDLISGYLGRTAKKTMKIFKKAKNGVIFIDEAYSLGNTGNEDTYSKECIDIINRQLSENRDVLLIIAGYKKEIEECFFRINPGLGRRFPFHYDIEGYSGEELFKILEYKIKNDNWNIFDKDYDKIKNHIIKNKNKFINNAGDMETLLMKAKIKNARNINSNNFILSFNDFI
jgi:SpoVK/Ycf46/Vps4 family AAA+-type ATPase